VRRLRGRWRRWTWPRTAMMSRFRGSWPESGSGGPVGDIHFVFSNEWLCGRYGRGGLRGRFRSRNTRARRMGAMATTAGGVFTAPAANAVVGGGRPRARRTPASRSERRPQPRRWRPRWRPQWRPRRRRRAHEGRSRSRGRVTIPPLRLRQSWATAAAAAVQRAPAPPPALGCHRAAHSGSAAGLGRPA